MNPFGKGRMEAIRSLTMINIESLLLAVLAGLTLLDQGRPAWLALAAGAALIFAACLYGHKISYQDQQNHQEE